MSKDAVGKTLHKICGSLPPIRKRSSQHEDHLAQLIKLHRLPAPSREFRFCERRWRVDFCWPDEMVAVEVEGGVWINGRHNRGAGFVNDIQKYNRAQIMGYMLLRVTGDMIKSGEAIALIIDALKTKEQKEACAGGTFGVVY